jgi:predicted ATP-binding protein involved in virulence
MSKEDNIREILDEAAQEIVQVQSNPRSWLSWMVYLLTQLEDQATKEGHASRESYLELLSALQDAIRNRTRTGGWN